RVLLNEHFDVPAIGRFALGRYWRSADATKQQEYLKLFEEVIVQTYADRFGQYSGQTLKVSSTDKSDGFYTVHSQMLQPSEGEPIFIDWRLKSAGGSYKITDVIVEGVSMSVTQRSEYSAIIERAGGDLNALLKVMRNKANSAKSDS
ncbi:MAG: phospholipid-binding protein MlaC, partial [Dongiaceae bacterium]